MSKESEFIKACKEQHFTRAKELLQQGCNPNFKEDDTQATPLHYASQHGDLSFVKTLIETHKCDVEAKDKTKQTPLHYAAQNGCKDVSQYLIERNCNPEPIDENGDSPLHKACREGHNDLASLLSKKCDRQLKNKEGYTPVQLATNREINVLFRQHSEKIFAEAAMSGESASTGASTSSSEWQVSNVPEAPQQGIVHGSSAPQRSPGAGGGAESMSTRELDSAQGGQSSHSSAQYSVAATGRTDIDAESLKLIQQLTSQLQLPKASNEGAGLLQLSEYDEPPDDLELLVARVNTGVNKMSQDEYLLLKSTIASALSTSPNALYLVKLVPMQERSNSVELVNWGISNSLMDHSIQISPANEDNLKQHNVADIVYKGKCVFFNPTHYFEDGSGASGGVGSFPVKYISSDNDFDSEMGKAGDKPTVVEFTADWCPPSLYIAPHFAKLSVDYPELLFLSVDADLCRKAISDYGVRSYPNFQFVKDGHSFDELNFVGYNVEKLYSRVETWNREHANYSKPPDDLESIVTRIKIDDIMESDGYEKARGAIAAALKTTSNSLYLIKPGIIPMKEGSSNVNLVHWGISRSIMDNAHITPEGEDTLKKHNVADIVYQGKCFFFNPMHYFGKSSMADVGTFGIKYITSDEDLKKALRDAGDGPVIVEFTTHWCPPSLYIAPYFLKLSVDFPEILFLSVDVDLCDYSSEEFRVDAVPAFHFIKGGHSFSDLMFSGYSIEKLTAGVEKWNRAHTSYVVPTKIKRTVTVWENGFTVDNGPLRTGDTYADKIFMKTIYNRQTPQELVDAAYGGEVDLHLQDKTGEHYVKPKMKPFTGEGHKLGGPACAKFDHPKEQLSTVGLPVPSLTLDPGVQTTRVRIRLAGGQVLCTTFKVTQTIQDIRDYIDRTSYAASDPDMSYILMTTVPRRQYVDPTQTLADADLCNALITQKRVPKSEMPSLLASGWTTDNVKSVTPEPFKQSVDVPPECENPVALKTVSICKEKLDRDFFSNPYALPVISQYYHSAERVAHIPFLGPVTVVTCDHRGRQFKNEEHDITVTIPEGAIPEGLVVHFELAVAIIGPFNFSGSRRPISPILWMCPQETFEFQKPFTITLPHFLTEAKPEDLENVAFSKATEYCYYTNPDGEHLYDFKTHPDADKPHFFSEDGVNYGSFQTSHCCLYCLENKKWTRDDMLKAGYFLHVVNAPQAVYFCVTFYLSSCSKEIEEKYSKKKHFRIQKPIRIELQPQMDGSDLGPHIQITLDEIYANSIITQIPHDGVIKASEVDFWECSESLLKKHHETGDYPPKVELRLNEFTPQLCIKGCSKEKDVLSNIKPHLKFSIESFMPSLDPRQVGWIPNPLHTQPGEKISDEDEDEDITLTLSTIDDTRLDCDDDWDDVVTALEKLKAEWKVVGRKLHIKSAKLKELESNFPKNCGTCLSDVVQEWLVGNYNVKRFGEPSWRQLAKAMSQLNMEVFRCVAETHSQH